MKETDENDTGGPYCGKNEPIVKHWHYVLIIEEVFLTVQLVALYFRENRHRAFSYCNLVETKDRNAP
jgi:hypothetical protein